MSYASRNDNMFLLGEKLFFLRVTSLYLIKEIKWFQYDIMLHDVKADCHSKITSVFRDGNSNGR